MAFTAREVAVGIRSLGRQIVRQCSPHIRDCRILPHRCVLPPLCRLQPPGVNVGRRGSRGFRSLLLLGSLVVVALLALLTLSQLALLEHRVLGPLGPARLRPGSSLRPGVGRALQRLFKGSHSPFRIEPLLNREAPTVEMNLAITVHRRHSRRVAAILVAESLTVLDDRPSRRTDILQYNSPVNRVVENTKTGGIRHTVGHSADEGPGDGGGGYVEKIKEVHNTEIESAEPIRMEDNNYQDVSVNTLSQRTIKNYTYYDLKSNTLTEKIHLDRRKLKIVKGLKNKSRITNVNIDCQYQRDGETSATLQCRRAAAAKSGQDANASNLVGGREKFVNSRESKFPNNHKLKGKAVTDTDAKGVYSSESEDIFLNDQNSAATNTNVDDNNPAAKSKVGYRRDARVEQRRYDAAQEIYSLLKNEGYQDILKPYNQSDSISGSTESTTSENFTTTGEISTALPDIMEFPEMDSVYKEFLSYITKGEEYQPIHVLEKYFEKMHRLEVEREPTESKGWVAFVQRLEEDHTIKGPSSKINELRQQHIGGSGNPRLWGAKVVGHEAEKIPFNEAINDIVSNHKEMSWDETNHEDDTEEDDLYRNLPLCPEIPPGLKGRLSLSVPRLEEVGVVGLLSNLSWVRQGGSWSPLHDPVSPCVPRHRVAVIVPYRDRVQHLAVMLSWLHPLLRRQQLQYTIYVAEQVGNVTFNKGAIMNAGFLEVFTHTDAQCFVFHDVDLLAEDDRNMYSCPPKPRHLSVGVDTLQYKLPYFLLVGGVMAVTGEQFLKLNGYSNMYWGWGGEDDDMGYRMMQSGLGITRPPYHLARYSMIRHTKRKPLIWKVRGKLVRTSSKRYRLDGLNTLQPRPSIRSLHPLYTHLLLDVGSPPIDMVNFALQ